MQKWVTFLDWIDADDAQNAEDVQIKLELSLPKLYWKQLNTTFGCLGQIILNSLLPRDYVMDIVHTYFCELVSTFQNAYMAYNEMKTKQNVSDYLSDE